MIDRGAPREERLAHRRWAAALVVGTLLTCAAAHAAESPPPTAAIDPAAESPPAAPVAVDLAADSTARTPIAVDPAARLLDGAGAGEGWDVSARLEDGSHFFMRVWVTNEGPGDHTGVTIGYFASADGQVKVFRYGRARDRWKSSSDGRFLQIASAVLDLRASSGAVEIDTDKGGMKIHLDFEMPESPPAICARRAGAGGFDVLRLQTPARGTAWVEGMSAPLAVAGVIDITHAWDTTSEIDTVLRRIQVSGRDGDLAFFATSVVAPKGRAPRRDCAAVVDGGTLVHQSLAPVVETAARPLAGVDDGYPTPSRVSFRSPQLEVSVEPQREVLRVNPLDLVPQPFRALLGLRSSPRRIWAQSHWRLHLDARDGGAAIDRGGTGLTAVTYTNPP